MEKSITTALLVIASIIATLALINAMLPAAGKGSSALLAANSGAADRIKTDTEIVFASGNTGDNQITFWVKNVGTKNIKPINESDIFLTTPTLVTRVPHTGSASGTPWWEYSLEGGATEWTQAKTVKIILHLTSLSTGLHKVSIAVYNAVKTEKEFSV